MKDSYFNLSHKGQYRLQGLYELRVPIKYERVVSCLVEIIYKNHAHSLEDDPNKLGRLLFV